MTTYNKAFYRQNVKSPNPETLPLENRNLYPERLAPPSRAFAKLMEFCVAFIVALVFLSLLSFLSVRPTLNEVRVEAGVNWDRFVKAARERNDLIPGLAESIKGASPGQAKLAGKLFEERSILHRSNDPRELMASLDEMDRQLEKIERLSQSSPEINSYPPFSQIWKRVNASSSEIKSRRVVYNMSARRYNDLMIPFPQNIFSSLFGFVPLQYYPLNNFNDESGKS